MDGSTQAKLGEEEFKTGMELTTFQDGLDPAFE
jgi:hypothetical protein